MKIRTLCLGILSIGSASGYEIKKLLEGPFFLIYEASFGSIYPALTSLQDEGLVTCKSMAQKKRPDKKVYNLTPLGRTALLNDFKEIPGPDKIRSDFLVMMLFTRSLPPDHIEKAITYRIAIYQELLAHLQKENKKALTTQTDDAGTVFVRGYGIAILESGIRYLEKNRHLVEESSLTSTSTLKKQDNQVETAV